MNKSIKELKKAKIEKEIMSMKNKDLIYALKSRGLPVFGTLHQK